MSISSVNSEPLHVKPETDLNLATEANRIMYVINKIISRAKFVGLLKEFLKNDAHLLKKILEPNVHFYILQACDRYHYSVMGRIPLLSSPDISVMSESQKDSKESELMDDREQDADNDIVSDYSSSTDSKAGRDMTTLRNRLDNSLSKVICILEESPEIQKMAKHMEKELSPHMKFFIKTLTEFKNRMEVRLRENASQYKAKEKYLEETYRKNEKAKKEIDKLEEELVVTKTDANVCLIGRNILINRHQKKIEKIKQNSLEVIERRANESEKTMVNDWKNSLVLQEQLKIEYQEASEKYSNLLKDHLATEKTMRAKRTKVENQVLGWIQKFDQDIAEKQAEEEEIQALLDKETKEVNEIQKKLDEQEEDYDELMQEKAEYEEEILERRLYQFIVNRSARRIQRTYRLYKSRRLARKLAKMGKKGKKKGK